MLVPQLYLNGSCSEAIELYKKAFGSEVDNIMYEPEQESGKFVIHAEMHILGTRLMLSDHGGILESSADSTMEIVAQFSNEQSLRAAYQIIKVESKTITPIGSIFFSPCFVSFIDKFGVRWCFMV
ncbi:VOC family protein [Paenibacillus aquistagni]|uniref:VOC family protein n=1 Tax=Paenibacillus aquistagni TaxID=1852522 RepID=UPI00145B5240|nr:VOC family protein [Paenibacillus aquistagni]NMM52910.1 VOC family protein [Paenibacillus aquistagni]